MKITTKNAIFNTIFIFSSIDAYTKWNEIRNYINKPVYVGNSLAELILAIEIKHEQVLTAIDNDPANNKPYIVKDNSDCESKWPFCLPVERITFHEPEEKYKPFSSYREFVEITQMRVGESIRLRPKESSICRTELLCGFTYDCDEDKGLIFASLGQVSFQKLFDDFEFHKSDRMPDLWLPFGVKDND